VWLGKSGGKRETELLNDQNCQKSRIKKDNRLKKAKYKVVGSVVAVIVF